jgi:hypothetical protein
MRISVKSIAIGLVFAGPALAEAPADRIRSLYESVPFERVNASPKADILAHIEEMGRRRSASPEALAVPDLDVGLLLRDRGATDVLMDPRVLEAIARMPPDRAAQVLRLIEDHRAGINPVEDVPSLSLSAPEEPESLPLRGWVLARDENGAPYIQNGEDASSRLPIVPSMILGDLGRILSIQDDAEAFRVTLESGDVLEGEPRAPAPPEEPPHAVAPEPAGSPELAAPSGEPGLRSSPRPRPRPEGLVTQSRSDTAVLETAASAASDTAVPRVRPRARPAGLGG